MITSLKTFEALKRHDQLTTDGRRVMRGLPYRDAYKWMADQMRARLGPPPRGANYPWWAWARWDGADRRKPDLRDFRHTVGPGKFVRLEIEVPDSRVLLSDYEGWHAVLNGWYLSWSEAEYDAFKQRHDEDSEESRRVEMEESWNRIFDLEGGDPMWWVQPAERSIQATFWSLEQKDVVGADIFQGVNK